MLPLGGHDFPKNRDELVQALTDGLAQAVALPAGKQPVEIQNEAYPALRFLRIDLTGATIRNEFQPARPIGEKLPAVTAARFEMLGRPVYSDSAAVYYEVDLSDVRFEFQRDTLGRKLLIPVDAATGRIFTSVSRSDLDILLRSQLGIGAAAYGATIDDLQWSLHGQGERSLSLDLRVKASKRLGFVTIPAALHARGQMTIDEHLNARLSDLSVEGEGLVGTVVVGLLHSRLKRLEGAVLPLASYSLGRLKLHDLRIRTEQGLEIEATFGSGGTSGAQAAPRP
jgi:hypothetical protein